MQGNTHKRTHTFTMLGWMDRPTLDVSSKHAFGMPQMTTNAAEGGGELQMGDNIIILWRRCIFIHQRKNDSRTKRRRRRSFTNPNRRQTYGGHWMILKNIFGPSQLDLKTITKKVIGYWPPPSSQVSCGYLKNAWSWSLFFFKFLVILNESRKRLGEEYLEEVGRSVLVLLSTLFLL